MEDYKQGCYRIGCREGGGGCMYMIDIPVWVFLGNDSVDIVCGIYGGEVHGLVWLRIGTSGWLL
jgi:hypothetical protein